MEILPGIFITHGQAFLTCDEMYQIKKHSIECGEAGFSKIAKVRNH
jgi:hypothetical protein